jgi:hypothetical protein
MIAHFLFPLAFDWRRSPPGRSNEQEGCHSSADKAPENFPNCFQRIDDRRVTNAGNRGRVTAPRFGGKSTKVGANALARGKSTSVAPPRDARPRIECCFVNTPPVQGYTDGVQGFQLNENGAGRTSPHGCI